MQRLWKIALSNRKEIITDDSGYKKLLDNISSHFVMIDGELVNPSHLVSVTKVLNADGITIPKKAEQIAVEELLLKQKTECKICNHTGWVEKIKEGEVFATPCECQRIKNISLEAEKAKLIDKFKING